MFGNLFRLRSARIDAHNENDRAQQEPDAKVVRALATGAALATAVDASPAVVVGIYDYAHRYRDQARRRSA